MFRTVFNFKFKMKTVWQYSISAFIVNKIIIMYNMNNKH